MCTAYPSRRQDLPNNLTASWDNNVYSSEASQWLLPRHMLMWPEDPYLVTRVTRRFTCKQTLVTMGILKPNKQITKMILQYRLAVPSNSKLPWQSYLVCLDLPLPLKVYVLQCYMLKRSPCSLSCELASSQDSERRTWVWAHSSAPLWVRRISSEAGGLGEDGENHASLCLSLWNGHFPL